MFEIIKKYAEENSVPIIREKSAEFLFQQVESKKPKKILEIGTAIGYSGLLMLKACDGFLTTIEKDAERVKLAKENFSKYNFLQRVNIVCDDAQKVLEKFSTKGYKFDFIFLDGPKGQYIKYLPLIKLLLNKNGVLFVDNIYLHGLVKSIGPIAHKHRTMVVNLRKFLKTLQEDNDFSSNFYDIEDGIAISVLK